MSSKVSKSDKAKLKFAQSNINYVYKGNTTETQHKPAVRQYGMQVVGKLQGTRRLPPPAWVPSIKAETGGLDSRVALVPAGGSGWGAPTSAESPQTSTANSMVTAVGCSSVTLSLSSVNGSLSREAIGTSFEPAYARSNFDVSVAVTTCPYINESMDKVVVSQAPSGNEKQANVQADSTSVMMASRIDSDIVTPARPFTWASRSYPTSSGGLAANKPFFQRPTPLVNSTSTSAQGPLESSQHLALKTVGASEIVGEPTGWAAVGDQEPNFDEHILFSDEEDEDDVRSTTSKKQVDGSDDLQSSTSPVPKSLLGGICERSSTIDSTAVPSSFVPLTTTNYGEHHCRVTPDVWSATDDSLQFRPAIGQSPHLTQQFDGGITGLDGRTVVGGRHLQNSTPRTFSESYFQPHLASSLMTTSISNNLIDSVVSTADVDVEIQNVQRQVRTQEFKSAVERAQQARLARQKPSIYSPETDMIQRSLVSLLSDSGDTKTSAVRDVNMPPPNQSTFVPSPFPSHLLFSSVYQQAANQNRPELAAAMAAATAVAFACNDSNTTPLLRPGGSVLPSSMSQTSQSQSIPPCTQTGIGGPWHNHFPNSLPTTGVYNVRSPTAVPQLIQNALALTHSGSQGVGAGTHTNPMFLDTENFVKGFLAILNQQQTFRSSLDQNVPSNKTSVPVEMSLISEPVQSKCSDPSKVLCRTDNSQEMSLSKPDKPTPDHVEQLLGKFDSVLSTDSPRPGSHLPGSQMQVDKSCTHSMDKTSDPLPSKHEGKRVPGLMDVEVSGSSRHFSLLWDQDETSGSRRHIHTKPFVHDRTKPFGKNRRHIYRLNSDRTRINKDQTSGSLDESVVSQNFTRSRTWQPPKDSASKSNADDPPKVDPNFALEQVDHELLETPAKPDLPAGAHIVGGDILSDISEERTAAHVVSKEPPMNKAEQVGSNRRMFVSAPKQRYDPKPRTTAQTDRELSCLERTDYDRRTGYFRRGRGSYFHNMPSRTFCADDANFPSTHGNSEYKYYSRSTRGGSFTTRGHRGVSLISDIPSGPRGRPNFDTSHTRIDRDGWTSHRTFQGEHARTYHDTDTRAQSGSHQSYYRSYGPTQDTRRHPPNQKSRVDSERVYSYRGSRCDEHFSDDDQSDRGRKYTCNNRQFSDHYRNRSHEGVRQTFSKAPQKLSTDTDNIGSQTEYREGLTMQSEEKSLLPEPRSSPDIFDDSDIPTVRVPATDMSFTSRAPQCNVRTGRSDGFSRINGHRRGSARINPLQHKRSSASGVQVSRRYRDLRDHYRDDKDGDGGAAAGGAGHSATSGNTCGSGRSGAYSGSTGCTNMGGGQNNGGNQESGSCDGVRSMDHHTTLKPDDLMSRESKCLSHEHTDGNHNNVGLSVKSNGLRVRQNWVAGDPNKQQQNCPRTTQVHPERRTTFSHRFQRVSAHRMRYSGERSSLPRGKVAIPSLMSIKPLSPLKHNSTGPDHVVAGTYSQHISKNSYPPTTEVADSDKPKVPVESSNSPDEDIPSDGFTEVVSKARKKLARRQMQQELSTECTTGIRRCLDHSSKHTLGLIRLSEARCGGSRNIHATSVSKAQENDHTNKIYAGKSRLLHPKPTFMGPPLSVGDRLQSLSSPLSNEIKCSSSEDVHSSNVKWIVSTPIVTSTVVSSSPSTTRTWSKVVGTKFTSVTSSPDNSSLVPIPSKNSWPIDVTDHGTSNDSPSCEAKLLIADDSHTEVITGTRTYSSTCADSESGHQWSSGERTNDENTTDILITVRSEVTPASSSVVSTNVLSTSINPNIVSIGTSVVSNNICKVKPQQQQPLSSVAPVVSVTPVTVPSNSVTVSSDQLSVTAVGTSCVCRDNERPENGYDVGANSVHAHRQFVPDVPHTCGETLSPQILSGYNTGRISIQQWASGLEGHSSSTFWPAVDPLCDANARLSTASTVSAPFAQMPTSDILANIFTNSIGSFPVDCAHKSHPVAVVPRNQSYGVHPFGNSTSLASDLQNAGIYSGTFDDLGKLSSNTALQSQSTVFPTAASSLCMSTQQQQSNGHPFAAAWTMQPNHHSHLSQQMLHSQRYRQRLAQPVEQSHFGNFAYPPKLQNEFGYLPSVSGCVPALSGGPFTTVQGHSHPNVARSTVTNPWSLLGNSVATSSLQTSNQEYSNTSFGSFPGINNSDGLLPHPVPQGGYNPAHGSLSVSSPTPSFLTHHAYVGVVGGGRSNTDQPNVTTRQRGLPQTVYPSHSLSSVSPVHGQQLQVHSAFYPSLSPHQHLQHLTGSQGRTPIHGLMSAQTGLYATAFGAAPSVNPPTTPPMPSQIAYASNFTSESAIAPLSFHSTIQSHSFPTVGLQPLHGNRSGQSSVSRVSSRNLGPVTNHSSSPLVLPGAIGPSGLSPLSGYAQPTPTTPMSGYPLKPILPTL